MHLLRRRTELGLILVVVLITAGAYALAGLGKNAEMPANIGPFLGVILALLVAAHIAVRKLAPNADGILLPLAALLNGVGYVFIVRLDEAQEDGGRLAGLQSLWTAVGIGAFIATLILVRRARDLERYRYTFAVVGIVLLVLPLVPVIGRTINGSRIWISLGPVNFQPGEPAKVVLAIFFAGYLVEKRELLALSTFRLGPLHLPDPKYLGPVVLAWGASLVVMTFEKDLGSSLLFFFLFVVMLWVATGRTTYVTVGTSLFAMGAFFAYSQFSHVRDRVEIWLNPWPVAKAEGFQVVEASFALADGGLAGTGIGLGTPTRIPEVETDFIFAAIGEELGLLGGTAILCAYILMVGAGLRIALRADSAFDTLLATGLTTLLGIQAFIIIGGITRVLPLTGVTLPFVSYGGSSLVLNYVLLALLLRISDNSVKPTGGARQMEATAG
ncbi:FtsW/RodA/SpoVE family cell cycle protein [Actinospongicola halichondriae]|uniref:FtsW/RodA/SpoVE family cell cycle protein n=1 Tax=Actinospongicola halichondriae TaxID=3236844 RepID=UPI003D427F00